ncbi:MAG: nucleoside hydrolase [Lachnospiraceae bacterium]|nr:nucleoside hydrolase [Lachnospiraceae bacterium]
MKYLMEKPDHPADVVLDTDTYNEIDDQFALAYLIRKAPELRLKAIFAAPFINQRASSPEEGMERSFEEIHNVLTLMKRDDLKDMVFRGSGRFLENESTPVHSDAANELIRLAREHTAEDPLYVIAIAAITDVASALLIDPEIKDRIAVVWLGCHVPEWPVNDEFNFRQDIAAARVVFQSGVRMTLLPCKGVVSHFMTTEYELRHWMTGKNALSDYLMNATISHAKEIGKSPYWSKQIWDVTAVAWLLKGNFMKDRMIPAPLPEYDLTWNKKTLDHEIRYVYWINRDDLMEDLFQTLTEDADA